MELPKLPPGKQDNHHGGFVFLLQRDLTDKEEAALKKIADEHFESHKKAVLKAIPDATLYWHGQERTVGPGA